MTLTSARRGSLFNVARDIGRNWPGLADLYQIAPAGQVYVLDRTNFQVDAPVYTCRHVYAPPALLSLF
jgi:hypothetical protein